MRCELSAAGVVRLGALECRGEGQRSGVGYAGENPVPQGEGRRAEEAEHPTILAGRHSRPAYRASARASNAPLPQGLEREWADS